MSDKRRHKNRINLKSSLRTLQRRYDLKIVKTSDQPLTFMLTLIENQGLTSVKPLI